MITSTNIAFHDRSNFSVDIFFVGINIITILVGSIPLLLNKNDPMHYENGRDLEGTINGEFFIHSILAAVVVSVTLGSDTILDIIYGNTFMSSITKQRWFLLFALGLPNVVMYVAHLNDSLRSGLFMVCLSWREIFIQSALLYFHYSITQSKIVRGVICMILCGDVIGYEILAFDNFHHVGTGLKVFAFILIGCVFMAIVGLSLFRIRSLLASIRKGNRLDLLKPALGVAYTVCLGGATLSKYIIFLVFSSRYSVGTINGAFTVVDIAVVLTLSGIHSRLSKLDSLSSLNMLSIKRNFVRYISHEIRTPLNTISMGVHYARGTLLKMSSGDTLDVAAAREVGSMMADVEDSCDVAICTLNNILTYDKLESGDMPLEKKIVAVVPLILKTLQPFSIQAANLGINFRFDGDLIEADVHKWNICVDVNKASQVLRNLVSNALKFTPSGGDVTVTSVIIPGNDNITGADNNAPAMLKISVKDSGVGISKENQKKLFSQIIQFDAADLQNGNGSGLGLWISNSMVTLHHGQLLVDSSGNGDGSTFTVILPLSHKEDETSEFAAANLLSRQLDCAELESGLTEMGTIDLSSLVAPVTRKKKPNIQISDSNDVFPLQHCLVVDDVAMNRKLLARLVKPYFSKQTQCENGLVAVDAYKESIKDGDSDIAVIFMDSVMPVLNGIDATRGLRELGFKGMIIGVTGNVLNDQIDDFIRNGANCVLPKPVNMTMLDSKIKEFFVLNTTKPSSSKAPLCNN